MEVLVDLNGMQIKCAYDKLIPLNEIKAHPKNPNKHTKEQIERLAKILAYQGIRRPVRISNRSGFITAGHGLVSALKHLGQENAPVNYQDYQDDDQEYSDIVSDNSIAAWAELDLSNINLELPNLGPDFDLEWLGLKDFELEAADKYGDKDADAVPEVKETNIKLGDMFKLGNHTLLCGDSTDKAQVERLMNGEKADMVYTDPPYGANIVNTNGSLGGSKPFGNIGNMVGKMVKAGNYPAIIGDETTDTAKASFKIALEISDVQIFWGAQYYAEALPPNSGWIVWDKQTDGSLGDGELAYSNVKKAIRIFQHKWSGMIKASEHGQRRVHPTQKPIALAEWCFENYGNPKNVLDLFLGSGSTLIACEKTNRKCFGMEIDPQYTQVVIDRFIKFVGSDKDVFKIESDGTKVPYAKIKSK